MHPVSPGYVTNPATDLTTPLRPGLLENPTMPITDYQLTPQDGQTLPIDPDAIRHAHPVDLAPATRTRRPARPVRDHRAETSWWAVAAGLSVTHLAALTLGVLLAIAVIGAKP